MNVLFLTLLDCDSFEEHNIYCDLLRAFMKNGHDVFCVSPVDRRRGLPTHLRENGRLLKLRIGNTQKTNIIEKGISTLCMERQFIAALRRYFSDVKFDLVLYSTPPITLANAVAYIKRRDGASTYLLLKDIFPQNAVDLGMLSTFGIKAPLYRYFRRKEQRLYALSDRIGCMSQANADYVIAHNPAVAPDRVEVCPNSIEVQDLRLSDAEKAAMRRKYQLPLDKRIFVYGGNLGKPQGIPFLIECLKTQEHNTDAFFLIVGDGTEYGRLEAYFQAARPANMRLMKHLPKDDYDRMIAACDVGLLFLDHRFTIPNFPSRLLSYMQAGLPVLACTDPHTDVGQVIADGGFGWWCESDDAAGFGRTMRTLSVCALGEYGQAAGAYLAIHYSAEESAKRIINSKRSGNI